MNVFLRSIFFLLFIQFMAGPIIAQKYNRPNVVVPNGFEVNSYTGNLYYSRSDFKVPGQGLNIDINFYYNASHALKNWGMGKGWTFTYNMAYTPDSLGLWIERADGSRDLFKKNGNFYLTPVGIYDTLTEYQAGKFLLTTREGIKYFFDNTSNKRLTLVQDQNNNKITIGYSDSLVNTLSDATGHSFLFTWQKGLLTKISDNSCTPYRTVSYAYDTANNLIKVTNPLGDFVNYFYDKTNKIIGYTDENGYSMSIVYNSNNAVQKMVSCITTHIFTFIAPQYKTYVTEIVNGQKQVTSYQFDTLGRIINKIGNCCGFNTFYTYDSKSNPVVLTDGVGASTKFEYNNKGSVTKKTYADGATDVYTYVAAYNKIATVKDRNGNITTYQYDAFGNVLQINRPLGITEKFTYDSKGNVLTHTDGNDNKTTYAYNTSGYLIKMTDAENGVTQYTYDCHGNVLSKIDALNNITTYQYNALDRPIKITDALGNFFSYAYDKKGNLITTTNPLGKITTYVYDGLNRKISTISPLGYSIQTEYDEQGNTSKTIDGNGKVTSYTYNSRKQVVTEKDALSGVINYEYDEAGNRVIIRDKKGAITKKEYDESHRVIKATDALNGTVTYNYDALGNRISHVDANGNVSRYEYDALQRLIKITDALNKSEINTYDGNSNKLTEKDKNGNVNTYTFDKLNRVKTITNALGAVTTFTYNANGNILQEKDPLNHVTTKTYDKLNHLLTVSNALNETIVYTYDALGNNKTTTQPNGNIITSVYNDDNQLISVADVIGSIGKYTYDHNGNRITETDGNGNTVSYMYDPLNRVIQKTDALNKSTLYAFDANGNSIGETDRNGNSKSFAYDILNRKIEETDALGNTTTFTYDANGNRVGIHDAKGNPTSYSYNALNQLMMETYADGTNKQYTYDDNGNIKTDKDNNGNITNYTYDAINRMTKRSYSDGSADVFTYSLVDKRLTANNANATINYTYDNANRILSEALNNKTTKYSYTTVSNTKTITYPGGRIVTEERDKRDRLISIKDGVNIIASFSYDTANRLKQKIFANGYSESYGYNKNNWLTSLTCQPNGVLNFIYTYDNEGNRVTTTKNHHKSFSEKLIYDKSYQLTGYYAGSLSGSLLTDTTSKKTYSYDALHNRVNSREDSVIKNYTVNNMNAYTNINDNGISKNFSYDKNGNTIQDEKYSYQYNSENKLTGINSGNTALYAYDALGRKVRSKNVNDTTNYYYNGLDVIEERSGNNTTIKKTYIFGTWLDDVISYSNDSGHTYFLANNLQGTVYAAFDNNTLVERYEYDGFGNISYFNSGFQSIAGTAINNKITFTGRTIIVSDIYDYRARVYRNYTGRFNQRDPLEFVNGFNAYTAYFLPNNIDPYGLSVLDGFVINGDVSESFTARVPTPFLGVGIEFTVGVSGSVFSCCKEDDLQTWGTVDVSAELAIVFGGKFKNVRTTKDKNGRKHVRNGGGQFAKKPKNGRDPEFGPGVGEIEDCPEQGKINGEIKIILEAGLFGITAQAYYIWLSSDKEDEGTWHTEYNWDLHSLAEFEAEAYISVGLEGEVSYSGPIGTRLN